MSIGEKLAFYLKVKSFQCKEQFKALQNAPFCFEIFFLIYSFFSNPFRVASRFNKRKGEREIHTYGETPFTAFQTLMDVLNLNEEDTFYDLGCGRGKLCFWVSLKTGCKVRGWDWNPKFISRASRLQKLLGFSNLTFECKDFTGDDFADATCIYLFGLFLKEEQIKLMEHRFTSLKSGTRLVCVGFPFSSKIFMTTQTFLLSFPWGKTKAYLQAKK